MTMSTTEAVPIGTLLFRFRRPIKGAKWVSGGEEHPWMARRNRTGVARVSAILARALIQALNGAILAVGTMQDWKDDVELAYLAGYEAPLLLPLVQTHEPSFCGLG